MLVVWLLDHASVSLSILAIAPALKPNKK